MPDDDMTWWGRKCWADGRKDLLESLIAEAERMAKDDAADPHPGSHWGATVAWLKDKQK